MIGTIGLYTKTFESICIFDGDDILNSNTDDIIKKNDNSNSNDKNTDFG